MPNLLQQYLKDCGEVVARHKEAYARDQEAAAFQDLKRIVAQLGLCNTLTMLADVCTEASQLEDDDWEKASILIADCAAACDLKYDETDDSQDANDDDLTRRLDDRMRAGEFK